MAATTRSADAGPVLAITVASWFPAVDDTTKGRFVADQVEALRSTGAVEPVVISFEPARLTGGATDRQRQAAAVERVAEGAIRAAPAVFSPTGWACPRGIPVARLPVPNGNRRFASQAHHAEDRRRALGCVAGRLVKGRRTVIHAHTGYPDGSAAVGLSDLLDAPLIITEHATFVGQQLAQPPVRDAYLTAVRHAARLVAVSETLADELRAALPECASKVVVIPNAVAMGEFRPGPLDERRPDELLYVGYRTETKGIDVLLAAFARVRAARSAATLRLIGRSPSDELEDGWRRLAAELGVDDAVTFEGPMLRSGVADAMAEASLLVHASRRETFGVAPVEALASGLPVVASDTGPLREILGPDPTPLGALAPIGDPEALAAAILETLERRPSLDPLRLRRAVENRFGGDAVARRIVDLYDTVLIEHEARGPRVAPAVPSRGLIDPLADRTGRRTLLVCFDTARAVQLLAAVPPRLRGELSVLCTAGTDQAGLPGDLAAVAVVDVEQLYRAMPEAARAVGPRGNLLARVGRLIRNPRTTILRRRIRRQRDRLHADAVRRVVGEMAGPGGRSGLIDLVCVDGLDYLAAEPSIVSGHARAVPGGVRWLADRMAGALDVMPTAPLEGTTPAMAAGASGDRAAAGQGRESPG